MAVCQTMDLSEPQFCRQKCGYLLKPSICVLLLIARVLDFSICPFDKKKTESLEVNFPQIKALGGRESSQGCCEEDSQPAQGVEKHGCHRCWHVHFL